MNETAPKDAFLQSVKRCAAHDGFIPAFYERFLASSDVIRDMFRDTDFEKQNQMLLRSLELSAGATAGEPEALREIQERAVTHDRDHLNVHPDHYALWLDSIISTAGEFDPEWNKDLQAAWQTILGHVIRHMTRKY